MIYTDFNQWYHWQKTQWTNDAKW